MTTDVGTTVLAICAIVGLITAIVAWFFKRGADEREFSIALRENTKATTQLTEAFHDFRDESNDKFHALDVRVTKLEAHTPHVSATAHRNPSPAGGH